MHGILARCCFSLSLPLVLSRPACCLISGHLRAQIVRAILLSVLLGSVQPCSGHGARRTAQGRVSVIGTDSAEYLSSVCGALVTVACACAQKAADEARELSQADYAASSKMPAGIPAGAVGTVLLPPSLPSL